MLELPPEPTVTVAILSKEPPATAPDDARIPKIGLNKFTDHYPTVCCNFDT